MDREKITGFLNITKRAGLLSLLLSASVLEDNPLGLKPADIQPASLSQSDPKCPTPWGQDYIRSGFDDWLNYIYGEYPQLKELNLAPRCVEFVPLIESAQQTPTTVVNFTDYTYNPQAAYHIYRAVDRLRENPAHIFYNLSDKKREFAPTSYPILTHRTMVLIPDHISKPDWVTPDVLPDVNITGSTLNQTVNNSTDSFSYAQAAPDQDYFFKSAQAQTTLSFAVETCQQSMSITIYHSEDEVIEPWELQTLQEILCNGVGIAIAAAVLDVPYQEYLEMAQNKKSGDSTREERYPVITMEEDWYKTVPAVGYVIN